MPLVPAPMIPRIRRSRRGERRFLTGFFDRPAADVACLAGKKAAQTTLKRGLYESDESAAGSRSTRKQASRALSGRRGLRRGAFRQEAIGVWERCHDRTTLP